MPQIGGIQGPESISQSISPVPPAANGGQLSTRLSRRNSLTIAGNDHIPMDTIDWNYLGIAGYLTIDASNSFVTITIAGVYRIYHMYTTQSTTTNPLFVSGFGYYSAYGLAVPAAIGVTPRDITIQSIMGAHFDVGDVISGQNPAYYLDDGAFATYVDQNVIGHNWVEIVLVNSDTQSSPYLLDDFSSIIATGWGVADIGGNWIITRFGGTSYSASVTPFLAEIIETQALGSGLVEVIPTVRVIDAREWEITGSFYRNNALGAFANELGDLSQHVESQLSVFVINAIGAGEQVGVAFTRNNGLSQNVVDIYTDSGFTRTVVPDDWFAITTTWNYRLRYSESEGFLKIRVWASIDPEPITWLATRAVDGIAIGSYYFDLSLSDSQSDPPGYGPYTWKFGRVEWSRIP